MGVSIEGGSIEGASIGGGSIEGGSIDGGSTERGSIEGGSEAAREEAAGPAEGTPLYTVWDAKLSRRERPQQILQLCCYAEMLGEIQV